MAPWTSQEAEFNGTKMSNPKRKQESGSSEASPEKRTKFDARNKFLLTPFMRQKREAALEKLQSLEKESTSNLDVLPNECILQILHHLNVPEQDRGPMDNPGTSSLLNFVGSMNRAKQLWNKNTSSILIGMQEKQYPHLLTLLGRVGHETEAQLSNLRCAVETQSQRGMLEDDDYYMHLTRAYRIQNPKAYKQHVVRFLGGIARFIDEQIHVLRRADFDNFGGCHQFSQATVKRALVRLWRMGWEDPDYPRLRALGTEMDATFEVASMVILFSEEPEEVQSCIRELLLFAGKRVEQQFELENQAKWWADDYFARRPVDTDEERLDVVRWARNAINATVLAAMLIYGFDDNLKGCMTDHGCTDAVLYLRTRLVELYDLKIAASEDEDCGPAFRELECHIQLREALNLGDIISYPITEELELRRNHGLPYEGEL